MTKKAKIQVGDFTLQDISRLVGELAESEILHDKTLASMNAELDMIRAQYDDRLIKLSGSINIRREALSQWAKLRKELFKEKRSMDFERGTIGFRTGMPKLKLLAKRTWDHIKANFVNAGPRGYTRTEISVDKEKLIADRETLGEGALREIGVKVVQEDSFYCDVKKDAPSEIPQSAFENRNSAISSKGVA